MTTVLVTKDFILADRKVVLHSLPRERKKLIVTKKFAIFTGKNYLETPERKLLTSLVRNYLEGKIDDVALLEKHDKLTGGNTTFVFCKNKVVHMEDRSVSVYTGDALVVPMGFGSGEVLALSAYFAGVDEKKITELVSNIDHFTSEKFDIVYRKDLEELK